MKSQRKKNTTINWLNGKTNLTPFFVSSSVLFPNITQVRYLVTQMNSEPKLLKYMEERMEFLDQIRVHLTTFPLRPPSENNGAVSSSTVKSRNARELAKMKTILNGHFYDLRSFRRNQLDRLIEQAQKSRDDDLTSFFDDLHEIGHPNNGDPATFSSSSDENQPSTSERSCRPRRVQTWIGSKAETHQCMFNSIIILSKQTHWFRRYN